MSRGGPKPADLLDAHAYLAALDAQLAVRRQWAALFEAFDVVVAPVMGVTAFAHQEGEFNERTLVIDGETTPYGGQIAWPGMATLANLPATAVPIGATRSGMPIGAQVIGPYLEDFTPLAFAGLIGNA
jgi:amidase